MSSSNPYISPLKEYTESYLYKWYLNYKITNFARDFNPEKFTLQKSIFKLFNYAVKTIPSYKTFLKESGWRGAFSMRSKKDWDKVPAMAKDNYISRYPLSDLVPGNNLGKIGKIISLSSGSSGKAFLWPRGAWQEIEGAVFHEQLLTSKFDIANHKTLVVICFSMGSYLAGTYTYNSVRLVAAKGYDLSVITPGIGTQDTLDMIKKLAPHYDQIILSGYPPFIKDLLEEGLTQGLNWADSKIGLMLASEFFSEKWRLGVAKLAGIKDVTTATTNIYGASEGTLFGWETEEAIFIRQSAAKNPALHLALFGSDLTPTLSEYNPHLRYFEVQDGNLYLTAWGGIPLIKYALKDRGGILTAKDREHILSSFGIDLKAALGGKISVNPMVYVLGRADHAASIYGVLIYPEYIKLALESQWTRVTGKFTIDTNSLGKENPELNIHIELKSGKKNTSKLVHYFETKIKQTLLERSREYVSLESVVGQKAWPHVYLHAKNNQTYFPNRIKHKWISPKS